MAKEDTELDTIAALVAEKLKEKEVVDSKVIPQNTPQNSGEELNLFGQKFNFKDRAEMEASLAQTFEKTAKENEALRQQLAKLDTKQSPYVSGKENEPEEFNQEKYIELMGKGSKGILEATNYALNHAIFQGKEKDAATRLRNQVQESENLKATVAVYQFREKHPEFQLTQDNTKVIDGIRNELGLPFNLAGLEASYGVAQSRGLMTSPQVLAYQQELQKQGILPPPQQVQQTQNTNLGFQPPPTINRQTVDKTGDIAANFENLTLEQMEQVLRKAGQL